MNKMPMFGSKPLQHLILIALTKQVPEKNKTKYTDWVSFVQVPAPLNLADRISFVENFNSHFSL